MNTEAAIQKRQKLLRARYKAIQAELGQLSEQLQKRKSEKYHEKLRQSRERTMLAVQLRDQGTIYRKIGERFGVTAKRAKTIVDKGRRILAYRQYRDSLKNSYDL